MTLNPNPVSRRFCWTQRWVQQIDMFVVLVFLLQGMIVWADEVIDAKGPPYLFEVMRKLDGKKEGVEFYVSLTVGDEVCIRQPDDTSEQIIRDHYAGKLYLKVLLSDGTKKIVSLDSEKAPKKDVKFEKGCYTVVEPSSPTPPPEKKQIDNVKKIAGSFLTSLWKTNYNWLTSSTRGEGNDTNIPMLGTDFNPAKLVAGKDVLYLAWEGNQSLYWVHIYQDDEPLKKEGFVVENPWIVLTRKEFPSLSLTVGRKYTVKVKGKEDCGAEKGVFETVADLKSVLPSQEEEKRKFLEEIDEKSLSKDDKDILVATLLAKNGLLLEAYQKVAILPPSESTFSLLGFFMTHKDVMERTTIIETP